MFFNAMYYSSAYSNHTKKTTESICGFFCKRKAIEFYFFRLGRSASKPSIAIARPSLKPISIVACNWARSG